MSAQRSAALSGIRVLDLTQGVSGPYCTRLLSQMGARVIKVEKPGSGDIIRAWDTYVNGMCTGHAWVNPGKESIALDLRTPQGQEVLLQLVEASDILIENYVPGTLEAWGLGVDVIRARRPGIIFCRISGFGQDGPDSDRTALDLIIQGETGLLSTNGSKEEAAKISISIADLSGSMYATIAILESLYHRERTGEGQVIDLALFDAVMTWSGYFPFLWWYQGREPGRVGMDHHTMYPYGPYKTGDGKTIIVAAGAGSRVQWSKFCAAIGRTDLVDQPGFETNENRLANKAELGKLITAAFGENNLEHWLRVFRDAGIPAGPLNDFKDGMEHRRMAHRKFVVEVDSAVGKVKTFDFPPQISGLRSVNEIGPPELGEHSRTILTELGMSAAAIDRLVDSGDCAGRPLEVAMRAYEAVAQVLVEGGVECIFGVLGDDTAPVIVAAVALGIAYHPARHENQAVAMADGYSRATGRIGVATVTGGPGLTNALTAVCTAHRASSRVVLLVGAGRAEEDEHDPQYIREASAVGWIKFFPQSAALELLGIRTVKPLAPDDAASRTRQAFSAALHGTVALVLGRGLLLESVAGVKDAPGQRVEQVAPLAPDPADIASFVELMQEKWAVQRPLIVAGRGAMTSGAGPALERLAQLTGALLSTSLAARALFNGSGYDIGVCGSYATPLASELILQADCVLAFGAGLNRFTTYNNSLFPKAVLVHVDADQQALGRFMEPGLAIHADARLTAEAVVAELEARGHEAAGFRSLDTRERIACFDKAGDVQGKPKPGLIDPRRLMLELDRMLPAGRIVCVDAGQHSRFAIRYLGVNHPRNYMQAVDSGAIGLGLGTGIGAAAGRPGEQVVVAVGDGGMMMSIGDLETAVRLKLPIVVVISNDQALGSEVNVLSGLGLDVSLAQIPSPSFVAIAMAMGAQAADVRSIDDLAVVEQWMRERSGKPLVLDCRVDPDVRAH